MIFLKSQAILQDVWVWSQWISWRRPTFSHLSWIWVIKHGKLENHSLKTCQCGFVQVWYEMLQSFHERIRFSIVDQTDFRSWMESPSYAIFAPGQPMYGAQKEKKEAESVEKSPLDLWCRFFCLSVCVFFWGGGCGGCFGIVTAVS